jgi:hypothetical protein
VWFNHIEAQQVPGIIEVVVDEEAAIKKKQHEALASLLGPIGDRNLRMPISVAARRGFEHRWLNRRLGMR